MATIETLNSRIEGKEKTLDKLNKKMKRILDAQSSGWTKNPYYYRESDILSTQKEISATKNALAEYKANLKFEIEKANSRNVKPLMDFLEIWKENCIKHYKELHKEYLKEHEIFYKEYKEYCDKQNFPRKYNLTREDTDKLSKEFEKKRKEYVKRWLNITQFNTGAGKSWDENLEIVIEREKNRKYDDIINRTNKIVGQITDASGLTIDKRGNLNGVITGTKGKAKVETIGAGGYNIQIYHFRTLIQKW